MSILSEGDERLHFLLMCSLGRIIANEEIGKAHSDQAEPSFRDLRHIVDWLRAAIFNDAPWLSKVDDSGRPRKLLKYGTVAAMVAEVDRDMLRQARRNGAPSDGLEGTESYMELGEGWCLVRLLTARALDYESSMMQHCIGNGGYDAQLADPESLFLSLRDPSGKPHATIAVNGSEIVDVSGKQNELPRTKYIKRMAPFFLKVGDVSYLDGSYGVVMDVHGKVYGYDELPEVLEVSGDLHLHHDSPHGAKCRLPRVIRAGGGVAIEEDIFEGELELVEAERVDVAGTGMLAKHCAFKVSHELDLSGSDIEQLPDNLVLNGNLQLKGAALTHLPKGLSVGGELDLKGTDISVLPDDLSAFSIRIEDTEVTSLGPLRLLKDVFAANSKLAELPADLFVQDVLDISESAVTAIPEGICVLRGISASGCKHIRLPRRLDVGYADFSRSGVYMKPGDFECTHGMNLNAARVILRGRKIVCGGRLDLAATHFDRLPDVIRAPHVNLERRFARELNLIDSDIETDVLVMSDADAEFGSRVVVRERIEIVAFGQSWSFPVDGARRYLANRAAFHSIAAACDHFGGSHAGY
ncbi:PcfJ domain-containing protein [Pararhizobium sp. BT-229]|uniref:PcfJ domain-containing protein n=1 Tax=Pararhizobium sp. BT-229 TaxID=2986923 RepID=UPI0021F731EE|nr:PcfJ domain-containing protein [Pararhizobium sp. BT-229]MCV9964142.1 PcfJ domain-containing protein [Pararhizobium sp. BT-229]